MIIFLHIPKCGGTSVYTALKVKYPNTKPVVRSADETLDDFIKDFKPDVHTECLCGHHVWDGIHNLYGKEGEYFTTLRNPIDRVISHYNFYIAKSKLLGLGYCCSPVVYENNRLKSFEEWFLSGSDIQNIMCQWVRDFMRIDHPIDEEMVDIASKRLADFACVGILESPNKFCQSMGIAELPRENASKNHFVPTDRAYQLIREHSKFDFMLYERFK